MMATTFDFRKYSRRTIGIAVLSSSLTGDAFIREYCNASKSSPILNRFDANAWNVHVMGCLDGVPVDSSSNDYLFLTIGIVVGYSCVTVGGIVTVNLKFKILQQRLFLNGYIKVTVV